MYGKYEYSRDTGNLPPFISHESPVWKLLEQKMRHILAFIADLFVEETEVPYGRAEVYWMNLLNIVANRDCKPKIMQPII